MSAVSDEEIIHRTNAVTACLQAELPVAMINFIPMMPNIVYTFHSVRKRRDLIYTIQP